MEKSILFYISPGRNLHKDFIMEIPFLSKSFSFDTYYFWDGGSYTDNYEHLGRLIDDYLRNCAAIVLSLAKSEVAYLPVDISDQYYGVFRVRRLINWASNSNTAQWIKQTRFSMPEMMLDDWKFRRVCLTRILNST